MDKETFMADFGEYHAKEDTPKKHTTPPCDICGWSEGEAIHQNPNLIGKGGPYHVFNNQ